MVLLIFQIIKFLPQRFLEIYSQVFDKEYEDYTWLNKLLEKLSADVTSVFNFKVKAEEIKKDKDNYEKIKARVDIESKALAESIKQIQEQTWGPFIKTMGPISQIMNMFIQMPPTGTIASFTNWSFLEKFACLVGNKLGVTTTDQNGYSTCLTTDNISKSIDSTCQAFVGYTIVQILCDMLIPKSCSKKQEFLSIYETNLNMLLLYSKLPFAFDEKRHNKYHLETESE